MKRDIEDDDDYGHLEEWEKITRAITKLAQKKSHAIYKRAPTFDGLSASEKLHLNPGKFIKKVTSKQPTFATYFSYHGSVTTPGIL